MTQHQQGGGLLPPGSELVDQWTLDPTIVFLNHGSFGACPRKVLETQSGFRAQMEAEPVRFFARELPELLDSARSTLAGFLGADADGLAFIVNATTGVNTALAAISLGSGDEILVTDHGYAACRNAVEVTARRAGAHVIEARLPFPINAPEEVLETILEGITPHTRIAVIDHVTSPTGLVFPVRDLVRELESRGVTTIVDGAHAPGMFELDLTEIDASFYTGNCHKWLCAPKGAAFLHVGANWRDRTHPLVTSHGASAPLGDRSRFRLEFDWTGTGDPSPWLSVPAAIETLQAMVPGGWPGIFDRNRRLVLEARTELCSSLGVESPAPDIMIGSLAAVHLPAENDTYPPAVEEIDPLQERLFREDAIEIPVTFWSDPRRRAVRISAHLHNTLEQYRYLAAALTRILGARG